MSSSIEALQQRLEQVEEQNYELAHDLEAERHHRRAAERDRDALAAHVERLNTILFDTYAAIDAGDVHALPYDEYRDACNDEPQASLASRDARVKAEALHELLMFPRMGDEPVRAKAVKLRDEYRQQAEETQHGH